MCDDLLKEIRDFLAATKMSRSAFGRMAVNDCHLIKRIEAGSVTFKMGERVRTFLAEQKRARGLQ